MTARRTKVAAGLLGLLAVAIGVGFYWFGGPPQMNGDDDVFRTVDALFTAIRASDERLVEDCQRRLRAYGEQGRLSRPAAAYLDDLIALARDGNRRLAAERLYQFMKGQRRSLR